MILVINYLIVENILLESEFGDQKLLIIKDPTLLGYLKETIILQDQFKKTYKKGMQVLDNGCSRHMCGKKEIFKMIKKIDEGYVIFWDKAKGEVPGVRTITLSSSCDLVEVYTVEGLKHNILSISQLCDVGFQVTFNISSCIIKYLEKRPSLIKDRVNNICVLNNVNFPSLTCLTTFASDPWLSHRKLGYASMCALEKLSRLELVIGLPN